MDTLIIITGGTLDKVHNTATETLTFRKNGHSHLAELLKIGCSHLPRQEVILMKDSLDMTAADRALILNAILAAPELRIVLTHGTGSMEKTARYLDGKTGDNTVV